MIEKPPKYQEKVEIEATYFDIQIKLQQLRQAPYLPPEGRFHRSWSVLYHCIQIKLQQLRQAPYLPPEGRFTALKYTASLHPQRSLPVPVPAQKDPVVYCLQY